MFLVFTFYFNTLNFEKVLSYYTYIYIYIYIREREGERERERERAETDK